MSHRLPLAPALLSAFLLAGPALPAAAAAEPIDVSPDRPQYFRHGGRDVLLLGGSREDNLFQIPELEEHLDLLVSAGGNYVRSTMSSRDEGDAWPFAFDEGKGAYDLDRWNEEYWTRFERLLDGAERRGIVVQVEIWATFDFYREPWSRNPFNPRNNLSYTAERTKLPVEVPTHPTWRENRFFWSVPDQDHNVPVLGYQQRFVDRLLAHTLRRGNVLYCMDNETSVTAGWGRFWATYVRKKAEEAGRRVHTTEMWDPWDLDHVSHRETFDRPELYTFVEISQNNHQRAEAHWRNALRAIERLRRAGRLRPVTNVKVYGADGGQHGGGTDEAVAKFVRNAFLGSAAVRFHRPPTGLGLGETARAVIRGVRDLSERMPFLDAAPRNDLLGDREENEAYCRALPGRAWAVYFPDGGRVRLDTSGAATPLTLRWLDLVRARWSEERPVDGGGTLTLEAPGAGHRVALVTAPTPR
jgi:hypothetical protein